MHVTMNRLVVSFAVALVLSPSFATAEDDLDAATHAAVVAAMTKRACVPPGKVASSTEEGVITYYSAFVAAAGTELVACVSRTQPIETVGAAKPFQCWTVDPTTKALRTRPAAFVAGRAFRIPSACAEGFCKPQEKPTVGAGTEVFALSPDGAKAARIVRGMIQIFDGKTKAFLREFPVLDENGEGTGLGSFDVILVGDTLIVAAFAAGPDGGAWMWNASTGKYLGAVGRPGEGDGHVNLSAGSYGLVDATHFVAFDGGYEEAIVDMLTAKISTRVMPKPAACSDEDWFGQQIIDIIGFGEPVKAKCTKAVRTAQKKFWRTAPSPGFVNVGGRGYKLKHGTKAELLVLEPKATRPKTVQLPICKLK